MSRKKILLAVFFLVSLGFSGKAFSLSEDGYKELHILSKVLSQVEKNYVDEVDDGVLVRNAIKGMLSGLDPHTVFMPPSAYKELKVDTSGKFGGSGVFYLRGWRC